MRQGTCEPKEDAASEQFRALHKGELATHTDDQFIGVVKSGRL
jgi:hypothetical protein